MAKFRFRLENILNLKKQLEKEIKNEYMLEQKKLDLLKDRLNKELNIMNAALRQVREKQEGTIDINLINLYRNYIKNLNNNIKVFNEDVKKQGDVVDKYRRRILEVTKEKKILEKLKEKKLKKYLDEEKLNEIKTLDEVISYKYKK